jgi:hypothetical protein
MFLLPSLSTLLPANFLFFFSNLEETEFSSHLEDQFFLLEDGHLADLSLFLPMVPTLLQRLIQFLDLQLLLLHLLYLILENFFQIYPLFLIFGKPQYLLLQLQL